MLIEHLFTFAILAMVFALACLIATIVNSLKN